jgi:glycosyltransferase involved in cell wall biosynthesis
VRVVLTHVYTWPEVRRGGERYLHELGAALQARGHAVTIISTAPEPSHDEVLGVEVVRLRRRRWRPSRYGDLADEVAFGAQVVPAVLRRRPDVWHAFGTADAAAAALVGRVGGPRSIYSELGIPAASYRTGRPDRRLHRLVVRHVDSYVCLSRFAADALRDGFGREGEVIGGGVDLARLHPGVRADRPTLLFSGALTEPRKNLALLLEAMPALLRARPDVQLWLSGPGDVGPMVRSLPPDVQACTTVVPLGTPDSLTELYGSAWATVLPSEKEAFGLVVLESQACGTPVVTLDTGAPSELVGPGTGVRSAPYAASLAEACAEALDLGRRPETAAACRAAVEPHSWADGIAPAFERLYA